MRLIWGPTEDKSENYSLNVLPNEILFQIFSHFSGNDLVKYVLPVCKRWFEIGQDPVLWTDLTFTYKNEQEPFDQKILSDQRFHYGKSLTLKKFIKMEDTKNVLLRLGNLTSKTLINVTLKDCAVDSETLVLLGTTCPNIQSLTLICCDENFRRNDHFIWAFMRNGSFLISYPNLKSLCLIRSLSSLSYDDAVNITKCSKLQKLIVDCDFYGRAIRYIINSQLKNSLTVLWLQGRNYNDIMCREMSQCRNLKELGLNHAENITKSGLSYIGLLNQLEKLLLMNANNLSQSDFRDFFINNDLSKLKYLNLSRHPRIIDSKMEEIIRDNCPVIKEIISEVTSIRRDITFINFSNYEG